MIIMMLNVTPSNGRSALSGDDILDGGSGDDKVWGAAGDDVVKGGAGNDEVGGGTGTTKFRGAGDDKSGRKETMLSKAEPEMTKLSLETRRRRSWRRQSLGRRRDESHRGKGDDKVWGELETMLSKAERR